MAERNRNAPPQRVHRHVVDRVVAYLTVPQQACARRASKALWEAVRAESMEDMLRATVHEYRDTSNVGAQLVFVAMSRAVAPFPSRDVLVEWCGGLTRLYEELQQRFPRAAAIGVSAQLAAIRPFPFASGSTVTAMCILSAHALDSVVLEVRNPSILVRALTRRRRVPHSVPRRRDARAVLTHAGWRPAFVPPTDPLHCAVSNV